MIKQVIKKTIDLGDGRTITIETGKLAKQADGAVEVRMGNTMLLATVCSAQEAGEGVDFMLLCFRPFPRRFHQKRRPCFGLRNTYFPFSGSCIAPLVPRKLSCRHICEHHVIFERRRRYARRFGRSCRFGSFGRFGYTFQWPYLGSTSCPYRW